MIDCSTDGTLRDNVVLLPGMSKEASAQTFKSQPEALLKISVVRPCIKRYQTRSEPEGR
jgi:hypothetical protein